MSEQRLSMTWPGLGYVVALVCLIAAAILVALGRLGLTELLVIAAIASHRL